MSDKKQIAEALRLAATYLGSGLHDNAVESLQRQANALDPPYKVDRSLRGWVLVVGPTSRSIWWACHDGLQQWATTGGEIDYSWATVEDYGWRVTKLHILQPSEVAVQLPDEEDWLGDEIHIFARFPSTNGVYKSPDMMLRILLKGQIRCLPRHLYRPDSPEAELEREKNR